MNSDILMITASISLLIVGIVTLFKPMNRIQILLNALLILFVTQLFQTTITPAENNLFITGIIGSLIGVNVIINVLVRSSIVKWMVAVTTILALLLVGKNELMYGEYSLNFGSAKVTGVLVLGFLIGALSRLIQQLLKSFFPSNAFNTIQLTAQIMLLGLFIIPATFFASWFGILLLAVGYFLYDLLATEKNSSFVMALLSIAAIAPFTATFNMESIDMSVGKVMAGFIVGVGAYALGNLASKSTNTIIKLGVLALGLLAVFSVAQLDQVHPAYGGIESYVAAFIGMAVSSLIFRNHVVGNILLPAFVFIGFVLPSNLVEQTPEETVSTDKETTTVQTTQDPAGIDASQLSGKFSIVSETAVISFQLGQKGGITKGAIKNFEGTVDFGNDINSAKFNVKLPTKKLTTFNSMRDESVLGAAYLNAAKYPAMSFSSDKMEAKEDGYLLKGNFTLLGKTNPEEVLIKYLGEKDGKKQFFGKAAIDRTKYGMASSPQEGNIVDFIFTIELK